jgi:hypothetical protein
MYRTNKLVYGLFVSVGIALLLAAYVLDNMFRSRLPGDVAMNLSVVTLSITMVSLLWRYAGGEPIEAQLAEIRSLAQFRVRAAELGVTDIVGQATDVSTSEWLEMIRGSRNAIDISSHTMSQFLDQPHLWQAVVECLKRGVQVRLLLNSAENPALVASGSGSAGHLLSRKQLSQNAWETFSTSRASLSAAEQANLTVGRLAEETLFVSIRRFDDKMYVAQYLYTDNMRNNLVLIIEGAGKPLFSKYLNEFEGQLTRALSAAPQTLEVSSDAQPSDKSSRNVGDQE